MYEHIEKKMLLNDQDKMPVRDVMMKDDDFSYLIDYILHHRYLASSNSENDDRIHLFETARTIITAVKYLSSGSIFFYNPRIVVDLGENICEFETGIRYLDNWHTEDADCLFKISFTKYKKRQGYLIEFTKGKKTLNKLFYPLNTNNIYSYDMNFPYPTEFRRIIKGRYNKIVHILQH